MTKRAAATEATRRRIVEAAHALHNAQGISATSWDEIAAHAGVGVGTVYRHFPSLNELIPACGEIAMDIVALPDPTAVPALFADRATLEHRIEGMVAEAFAIYDRGASELRPVWREPELHPALADAVAAVEASLTALVDSALEPLDPTDADRRITRAMIDIATWQALRDQGVSSDEAAAAVSEMLTARLRHHSD